MTIIVLVLAGRENDVTVTQFEKKIPRHDFQEMLEKKEEEEEEEVQHVGVCWLLPITDQKRRRKCGDNKRTSTLMYNSFKL